MPIRAMNRFERPRSPEFSPAQKMPERFQSDEVLFPPACERLISRYEKQRPSIEEIVEEAPRDLYSHAEVEKDIAYIERLERQFEEGDRRTLEKRRRALQRPQFAEAFLATRIEDENWFGKECTVFPTTRCDDVGNGVDFVLEWEREGDEGPLFFQLAIDATIAQSSSVLGRKADSLDASILGKSGGEEGPKYLSRVKYYRSPHTDEVQRLTFLPKVVMGLSPTQVDRALQLVTEKKTMPEREQAELILPLVDDMVLQLQQQVAFGIDEVCKKYNTFLPLLGNEVASPLLDEVEGLKSSLRHAVATGKIEDMFSVYDAFTALTDGPLAAVEVPDAYKDSVFVVHALIPVLAQMYQCQLEQKKRFTPSRSLTKMK